jgi:hypothetical protein
LTVHIELPASIVCEVVERTGLFTDPAAGWKRQAKFGIDEEVDVPKYFVRYQGARFPEFWRGAEGKSGWVM